MSGSTEEQEVLDILALTGAILTDDHFVYTAVREDGQRWHGSKYINKDAVFPHQDCVEQLCWKMAWRFDGTHIDVVVGPVAGGVAYAYETAKHLGPNVLRVYADKADGGGFVLKRGFDKLVAGKDVLVVEDILTTGSSVASVVQAVRAAGGNVVGVAALCNRGGVTADDIGVDRLECLVTITMDAWTPAECPLCKAGVAVNTEYGHGAQFLATQNQVVN